MVRWVEDRRRSFQLLHSQILWTLTRCLPLGGNEALRFSKISCLPGVRASLESGRLEAPSWWHCKADSRQWALATVSFIPVLGYHSWNFEIKPLIIFRKEVVGCSSHGPWSQMQWAGRAACLASQGWDYVLLALYYYDSPKEHDFFEWLQRQFDSRVLWVQWEQNYVLSISAGGSFHHLQSCFTLSLPESNPSLFLSASWPISCDKSPPCTYSTCILNLLTPIHISTQVNL